MPANLPLPRSCAQSSRRASAGVKVIGLIGGRAGCYGGGGLIAGCCSALAVSEQGRIAVSGPEVIETNRGVEEFDSRDRALVWRTMGGKHRRLIGGAEAFTDDTVQDFRDAALELLGSAAGFGIDTLKAEQARLEERLQAFRRLPGRSRHLDGRGHSRLPIRFPALPADAIHRPRRQGSEDQP